MTATPLPSGSRHGAPNVPGAAVSQPRPERPSLVRILGMNRRAAKEFRLRDSLRPALPHESTALLWAGHLAGPR